MTKNHTWKFWKSIKTQCFFIPLLQKLNHRYALICSNSDPNFKPIHQSICELYRFLKKCCKKKNTKKIRWTLKAYLGWIQLKFGIGGAPPQRNSHSKFRVFLFKKCFLYWCKIHTCLLRVSGFLGRTTHYCVSWYTSWYTCYHFVDWG